MSETLQPDVLELLREAEKRPWIAPSLRRRAPVLDRAAIENVLPHRGLFLLLDQVNLLDLEISTVVARYALSRGEEIFAGHFPFRPVWPGVLQIEAIAQAGILLFVRLTGQADVSRVVLTHILKARFIQAVVPGGDIEIVARVFEEGLFFTVVGQCLQNDRVCSVAALRGIL
jgi:3-hydroxyacyl-[acyl-carrier-protein] dehydratase